MSINARATSQVLRALRTAGGKPATRSYATASQLDLKSTLKEVIPEKREMLKKLKTEYGDRSLGEVKVENAIGGMRGIKCMVWEGSVLDANEGIRFHGKTIKVCSIKITQLPVNLELMRM